MLAMLNNHDLHDSALHNNLDYNSSAVSFSSDSSSSTASNSMLFAYMDSPAASSVSSIETQVDCCNNEKHSETQQLQQRKQQLETLSCCSYDPCGSIYVDDECVQKYIESIMPPSSSTTKKSPLSHSSRKPSDPYLDKSSAFSSSPSPSPYPQQPKRVSQPQPYSTISFRPIAMMRSYSTPVDTL